MNERDRSAVPPPFSDRQRTSRRYRYRGGSDSLGGSGDLGGADWQEDLLGKPRDESWGSYLGLKQERTGRRGGGAEEMFRSPNPHKLYRNTVDGKMAGVCAGIADYFNIDSWVVRLAVVLGFFFAPPAVLLGYVVMMLVVKKRPVQLYESKEEEVFWRSVTTKPDQTLAALRAKFRDIDRQIAQMEGFVSSREYDLHRQFRDLEK
ncbi:MAG TPA: envelope stress response membrane protein PspC [Azospirillaceae bacterium]|nr:envelope stress response membrane protein PspC [Azospirillaceae bacterium]